VEEDARAMIVDCHVNIWEDRHCTPLFREQTKFARPGSVGIKADAETLVRAMTHVDKAIIFSLRYGDSAGVDGDDEVTAAAVAHYPDKFVGFACIDPRMPDCMDLLVHAIEDLKLRGVKFGPIYNGVSVNDPRMEPIYRYLVKHDLPLTMHMGTTFAANSVAEYGRAIHVDEVARRHPDLKMVMAHMGHPWFEECIIVARKQPNVYCEVSALFYRPWQFWNILKTSEEYGIANRNKIFWGTDFPFAEVDESIAGLKNVNKVIGDSGLPPVSSETIEHILHSNPFAHWWHDPRAKGL
jgi:predicted TIM-barrel fold metal-dependent hydrolase